MSKAANIATTNRIHFASAGAVRRRPAPVITTLALPADLAEALAEMTALVAYHPEGFTYTREMERACRYIADRSGPAAIVACLARADIRERAYIYG
jgi:hypothetical protein